MKKRLAHIGISAILLFLASYSIPGVLFNDPSFDETILGQILISYIVLGGVVPWLYLIETSRGEVSKGKLALYFVGGWVLAPYFLIRQSVSEGSVH